METDIAIRPQTNNPQTKSKRDHALVIAAKGLPVFPLHHTKPDGSCSCGSLPDKDGNLFIPGTKDKCSPGKHPIVAGGYKVATTNPTTIKFWWRAKPDANIAIHPGEKFVYIDLDVKNGKDGIQALANHLGMDRDDLDFMTYCIETPSGGLHMYLKADKAYGNRTSVLPGVDVRAVGGYVLGEGSTIFTRNEKGKYVEKPYKVVSDLPVADIPDAIKSLLRASMERDPNAGTSKFPDFLDSDAAIAAVREMLAKREPAVEHQGGDEHTLVTIYKCRDLNISAEKALELLTEPDGWNDRCSPPWSSDELQVKIENAYKYAKKAQGNKQDLLDIDGEDSELPQDVLNVIYPEKFQRNTAPVELPEATKPASEFEPFEKLYDPWREYHAPAFPLRTLPPAVRNYVSMKADEIGVDVSAVAMSCLTAMSGVLSHDAKLFLTKGNGFPVSPRMWTLLVAAPSWKKTPAQNAAIGHVWKMDQGLAAAHTDKVRVIEAGEDDEKEKKKKLAELERDKPPQMITNDMTVETMADILSRQKENRGLLVHADELSGWIGAHDRYNNGKGASADKGMWLKAYDGGPYRLQRISRKTIPVKNMSVSLLGGIQPDLLRELPKLTSDGLLQRFLPVMMRRPAIGKDVFNPEVKADWEKLLDRLFAHPSIEMRLSPEARAVFKRLETDLHHMALNESEGTAFSSFVGKLLGMWGSISLLLHVAWDGKAINEVSGETATLAARIIEDFILPHGMVFYRSLFNGEAGAQGDHQAIGAFIQGRFADGDRKLVGRDFRRGPRCCRDTAIMLPAKLMSFTSGGWLEPDNEGSWCNGWTINPAVAGFESEAKLHRLKVQELQGKIRLDAAAKRDAAVSGEKGS